MKKKLIAALLAAGLVLGMFGISSAQPANDFTNESIQEDQQTEPEESAIPQPAQTPAETASPSAPAPTEPPEENAPEKDAQGPLEVPIVLPQTSASASLPAQTEMEPEMEESAADAQQPEAMALTADGTAQVASEEELKNALESGRSAVLTQDIALAGPVTVPAGANVELDLGGRAITASIANPLVNEGTMTVRDSVGGATVSAPRGCIRNVGTLSVNGGHYITTDKTGGSALFNGGGATMTVKSCVVDAASFAIGNAGMCTINGGELHSTSSNETPNWAYCIKSTGADARLIINDATVTGIQGGVAAVQGTVRINGGNFSTEQGNSRSFYALYVAGEDGEVNGDVYGGTFSSPRQAVYIGNDNTNGDGGINASACLNIHGGTFEGGSSALFKSQNTGTAFISGGTFRDGTGDSNIAGYVIDGYEAVRGEDGSVSVARRPMPVRNERTGETYETLQKAVGKALAGDTLLLGDDVYFGTTTQTGYDEDGIGYGTYGSLSKSLIIRSEGAARTVTATSIITVNNGAQVTLENVTVDGENRIGTSGINIQGSATLTLNDGAVVRGCATSSGRSAVGVGSVGGTGGAGKLVMNQGSLITQNVNSGVWLEADGILEMNGGAISGNNCQPTAMSKQAYGVVISGGTAVVNGGAITGNGQIAGGGSLIAGGGVLMNQANSTLTVNGGTIANNTKNGSIYVTAADCTVNLDDAKITGNSVSSYGSVGGSSSAANFKVNISGTTQIADNKYAGAACNLKISANMTVDITGLEAGAKIGVTPQSKAAGSEVASAGDARSVRPECFVPDSALNASVSLVRVGNKLATGYATTLSAAGLSENQFEYTGSAPALALREMSVTAANNMAVQDPAIGFVYYADDSSAAGKQLSQAPTAVGAYWARPVYDGDAASFYGAGAGADAYRYTIVTPVAAVSLNKANISLEMNTKGQLSAAVSPADAYDKSIVWASSDESVVKADKGLLTPVAPGTATVTATAYNGKSASCLVTITARPAPALPDTEGKTQVVVEPEIKGNTVDDGAVKDALANAQPDEAVVVKVEVKDADEVKDVRVSADVVALAAKSAAEGTGARTLVFTLVDADGNIISAVTLDLSGGADPDRLGDIYLGHTNAVDPALGEQARETLPEEAAVLFINLTHDGQFPCPVTRMDKVDGSFRAGDTVYLYWVSPSGALAEEQVLTVDESGYITYTITHASPYMISNMRSVVNQGGQGGQGGTETPDANGPDKEDAAVTGGSDAGVKDGNKTTSAPQTGDTRGLWPYAWLAALAAGAIAAWAGACRGRRKEER